MRYRVEAPSIFTFPSGPPPIPDISEVLSQRRVSSPLGITGELWDEPGYHRGNERRPGAPSRAAEHAFAARGIDLTAEQFDVTDR